MELDSDDSDIFVERQLKPVNGLTNEDGLRIKKKVLRQGKLNFSSTKKRSSISNQKIEVVDITKDSDVACSGESQKLNEESHPKLFISESDVNKGISQKKNKRVKQVAPASSKLSRSKKGKDLRCVKRKSETKMKVTNGYPETSVNLSPQECAQFQHGQKKQPPQCRTKITEAPSVDYQTSRKSVNKQGGLGESEMNPNISSNITLQNFTPKKANNCKSFDLHLGVNTPLRENLTGTSLVVQSTPLVGGPIQRSHCRSTPPTIKSMSLKSPKTAFYELNSPQKLMTDYFDLSPTKDSPVSLSPTKRKASTDEPVRRDIQVENMTLSPSIKRNRKKFKSVSNISDTSSPQKSIKGKEQLKKTPKKKLFDTSQCFDVVGTRDSPQTSTTADIPSSEAQFTVPSFPVADGKTLPLIPPTPESMLNADLIQQLRMQWQEKTPSKVRSAASQNSSPVGKTDCQRAGTSSDALSDKANVYTFPVSDAQAVSLIHAPSEPTTDLISLREDSTLFDATILTTIIKDVIEKQAHVENMMSAFNEDFFPLLTAEELSLMKTFLEMKVLSQTLYMRMFFRRTGWHRVSMTKYDDLGGEVNFLIDDLKRNGFVDTDIKVSSIKEQLILLNQEELRAISKLHSIPHSSSKKKDNLIDLLIEDSEKQRSVSDMFKARKNSRIDVLGIKVREVLGTCFQLNLKVRKIFSRVLLLFSLVHEVDDEDKRASSQRLMVLQVLAQSTRFVQYVVSPTVIFKNREDFLEYEKAIELLKDFQLANTNKDHATFEQLRGIAHNYFVTCFVDAEYCERVSALPTFLRKYSAGAVYSWILTKGCETFKKLNDGSVVIEILGALLDQHVFGYGSRGKWYDLLAQAYESSQMIDEAAYTILQASKDDSISDVWRCFLQLRAIKLLKVVKKRKRIHDENLREELDLYATLSVQEPASIEINAKAVSGNVQGSKLVYVQESFGEKRYCSVEEQAISYYKMNGFSGIHAEGSIVSTIFNLLFFDIIYAPTVAGVFQSSYQVRPLDYYSTAFYENRKIAIDSRLCEMKSWTIADITVRVESVFAEYIGTASVVKWTKYMSPLLLCEIIECIGLPAVLKLCERFIFKPRQARSGFPDLTLWNVKEKTCKFVEVKSPNDKLSPNQRVWMDYLRKAGIDCEVCNVKNTAGRKLKSAA